MEKRIFLVEYAKKSDERGKGISEVIFPFSSTRKTRASDSCFSSHPRPEYFVFNPKISKGVHLLSEV